MEVKALLPLPGKCVPIPQVEAIVRGESGSIQTTVRTHIVPDLDLDGYNSPVVLVPPEHEDLNVYNMYWRLFIQRGECGYELGIIDGLDDPVLEEGISNGLRNFSTVAAAPPGTEDDLLQGLSVTMYSFNGKRYLGGRSDFR